MSAGTEAQTATGTWTIDKVHSTVRYEVEHNSAATFSGAFKDVDATLEYGDDGVVVKGSVKVDSIELNDENLYGHVQSAEFFDAERYPTLDFESTSITLNGADAVVEGNLTVRGETKPVTVRGSIGEPFANLAGSHSVAVNLATTIDRTAYGLDWQAQLPNGNDVLGNEVKIEVQLELVQS
jgi:polyisoprenoid-binding protein YceI